MRRSVLAAALAIAAIACANEPLTQRPSPTAPDFSFVNGPADPGPIIQRSSDDTFFILFNTDRSTRLASLIRLPAAQADLIPCGGTVPLDPADLQLVFHANGTINQLMIGRDAAVFVYDRPTFVAALIAGGICSAIATQVPIAQGTVNFVAHDNDTFFSGIHADAFGYTAVGTVTLASTGATLRYRDDSHGVLAADGSLITAASSITMTAVP